MNMKYIIFHSNCIQQTTTTSTLLECGKPDVLKSGSLQLNTAVSFYEISYRIRAYVVMEEFLYLIYNDYFPVNICKIALKKEFYGIAEVLVVLL